MTGTADIAAQAGVSEGSIFYHFGSKHSLLVELGKLHGQRLVAVMEAGDRLETLTLAMTLNRCFDFIERTAPAPSASERANTRPDPEAEPCFKAAKEILVAWTKAHLDAQPASTAGDTGIAANLIFAVVDEAMQHCHAPGCTNEERQRIRAECIRFCSAAIGQS